MKKILFTLLLACFVCNLSYCISSEDDSSSNEAYLVPLQSNQYKYNPEFSTSSNEIEQGIIESNKNEQTADESFYNDEDVEADEGSSFEESRS